MTTTRKVVQMPQRTARRKTRRTNTLIRPVATDSSARFAQCRSMGHSWRHHKAIGSDDPSGTFRAPFGGLTGMIGLPSDCSVCGTERMRWVTRSGESIVRYEHPDGYSQHGEERQTASEWRRTFVSAVFDDFEQSTKRARA
jgi:hypothetical protein